jgi:hypothetical protein
MGNTDFCLWDSSCRKKVRYSHAADARMRIRRISRLGDGLGVEALATYRCRFCGGFHIGHTKCMRQVQSEGRG